MSQVKMVTLRLLGLRRRVLGLRRAETVPVLVAGLCFFFLLSGLMVLRPARDALGMAHGIESVRWLILVTAGATFAATPVFGWLVSRLTPLHLACATYGFLVASLTGFWGLMVFTPSAVSRGSGLAFYVCFNVFNLFAITVFWALLTDRFTGDQGRRFFALISIGGTLGAIFGPWLTSWLAEPLGTSSLLLISAGFMLLALLATCLLLRIAPHRPSATGAASSLLGRPARIGGSAWSGVRAVLHTPFLTAVAGYVILTAVMVTFVYFTRLQMVAAIAPDTNTRAAILGRIDMYTHVAVLLLQLTVAKPIVKRCGVGVALAILPVVTALGFVGLAIYGSFAALLLLEVATRAVQRAIGQPTREALFTVVSREDKYKAKAFIDTFIYRTGDVLGAQTEGALGRFGLALGGLMSVVLPLALGWVLLALWLGRAQSRLVRADDFAQPTMQGHHTRRASGPRVARQSPFDEHGWVNHPPLTKSNERAT